MNPLRAIGFTKDWWVFLLPLSGYAIGSWLDNKESERMSFYRDKSALYGRKVDKPSWP